MSFPMEYHLPVRSSIPASVALFGLLVIPVFFVASSQAQFSGASASAGSSAGGHSATGGFSGVTGSVHPPTGTVPLVNSLGPSGFVPNSRVSFSGNPSGNPGARGNSDGEHHHHHANGEYGPVWYAVPVPYASDNDATDNNSDANADDDDYQGGPTVFDRRGSGADSYVPPVQNVPQPHAAQYAVADSPVSEPPREPTLLVFKDGHTMEVGNYAIVGATLFDLTPGHPRRVALADLDLEATSKQNDDRGVTFQLPPPSQAN